MKVLHYTQLPARLPIVGTVAWATALSYFQAPGWVWGAAGLAAAVAWIAVFVALFKQRPTKIDELS